MKEQRGYKHSDVWLYVQNRMSREEETEFQQHLLHCEKCREELARLRLMVHSIGKKERRNISFRIWVVAASVVCVMMGSGAYYYFYSQKEGQFLPNGPRELEINPPVLYNDKDSIVPALQDTIRVDTVSVEITQ